MLTIKTKGNPLHPLVAIYSNAISEIYGTLTAIPTERLNKLSISQQDATIIIAEIKDGSGIRYINVYLDDPEDAPRLLAFLQHTVKEPDHAY